MIKVWSPLSDLILRRGSHSDRFNQHIKNNIFSCVYIDNKDVYLWMDENKDKKITMYYFLKTIKYTCNTVFVTWRCIYLKISTEPGPE